MGLIKIILMLIGIYTVYKYLNSNELYSNVEKQVEKKNMNKECSDKSINDTIFNYKLSDLNQTKTPN